MGVKDRDDVLHNIRAKLYQNNLPDTKGKYFARTDNEASLDIRQVCTALVSRGGFTGDFESLLLNVEEYFDEVAYQLCDGFSVNTGYFTIHPNIGGTFNSLRESFDPVKHPITARFRTRDKLRRALKNINVTLLGLADTEGFIDEFTDVSTGNINETVATEDMFTITGEKVKISSDGSDVNNERCGIFFELIDVPGTLLKVSKPLAVNESHKLVGMAPALVPSKSFRLVIVTQFNGSNSQLLKVPKTMVSDFSLLC